MDTGTVKKALNTVKTLQIAATLAPLAGVLFFILFLVILVAALGGAVDSALTTSKTTTTSSCGSTGTGTASLTAKQQQIEKIIVAEGQRNTIPDIGIIAALSTGQVESGFHVWASLSDPPSLTAPWSDGTSNTNGGYGDHGSLGVFQQQTQEATMSNPYGASTANWGTWTQLMDPATSADLFYQHLVAGGANAPLLRSADQGVIAQDVQGSAFPDRYAQELAASTAAFTSIVGRTPNMSPVTDPSTLPTVTLTSSQTGTPSSSGGSTPPGSGTAPTGAASASGSTTGTGGTVSTVLSNPCSTSTGTASNSEILTFAGHGYQSAPYNQCRPGCADITGVHSCQHNYVTGCELTAGEDCSGFTRWVYWNAVGIDIGSNTSQQLNYALGMQTQGWTVTSTNDLKNTWHTLNPQVGDLIVWGNSVSDTSHVAIYYGGGEVIEDGGAGHTAQFPSTGDIAPMYDQDATAWIIHDPAISTTASTGIAVNSTPSTGSPTSTPIRTP